MKSPHSIAKSIYYLALKAEQKDVLDSVLGYIKKRHMENILPRILFQLKNIDSRERKRHTAHVISAFDLEGKNLDKIKSLTSVSRSENVDLSLDKKYLGGFVVNYGGRIYDFSLKNRLNKLKESLINQE